MVENINFY